MISDKPQSERRILIVDDNEAIHADFRKILTGTLPASDLASAKAALFDEESSQPQRVEFQMSSALQGKQALEMVEAALLEGRPYMVAFVDMRMPPGWDGLQTIEHLWAADPNLQIIICTAYSDHSWEEISQKLGINDRLLVLKKPFDHVEVIQLATALSEKWTLKRAATLKMDELEAIIQERTRELTHLALHDKLTGLPNRALLNDRLAHAIAHHTRDPQYHFAVLFLDFDRFKLINDSLGHKAGDALLIQIARRLNDLMRSTDTISPAQGGTPARLGGDEFVILLDNL